MKRYKVIIVGGGPSGAMTALSLVHLRPGLAGDILLLEAKRFPREKICGGGLSGRVIDLLEELGIYLEGVPQVPVHQFRIFSEDAEFTTPFGHGKCCVTRRSVFDQFLLKKVEDRNIEVRTAARAIGAYREESGVAVIDRAHNTHHADVMVGADGLNGGSRTWFGVPHRGRKTVLLQTDFPRDPDIEMLRDSLVMDFGPSRFGHSGYVWFFPSLGDEGEPVVNAGITGGGGGNDNVLRLKEIFNAIIDRYPEMRTAAPKDIRFKQSPEREFAIFQPKSRERVLFVGDQLGADAFTGEGLSICAESAMAAAREILKALDRGDFSFKGYSRRLMKTDFFPLLLVGKPFWKLKVGERPPVALSIAAVKPSADKDSLMELYARLFSGDLPGSFVYSSYNLKTDLARTAAYIANGIRSRISNYMG